MSILRAKTLDLRQTVELTPQRKANSALNEKEAISQQTVLDSKPRRLVFELTNACNLRCKMCGRNSATFKPTVFNTEWLNRFEGVVKEIEEVTLMGWGEPTVHPQFADFLNWAHDKGLRKYFCTNGMRLDVLFDDIFKTEADIIAVSMDGACAKTNEEIRRGADFDKILKNISAITNYKAKNNLKYPYMNFVFTAMDENISELPDLVKIAAEVGLDEVKAVYLTAFDEVMKPQTLYDKMEKTKEIFAKAVEIGEKTGVSLKLPHLVGDDPAGEMKHKTCYTAWRDFFLGSDGYVRPCMSTAEKLFSIDKYDTFEEMWNSEEYQRHRSRVNNENMILSCENCYQSSYANWNKIDSFIQIGKRFSPDWDK